MDAGRTVTRSKPFWDRGEARPPPPPPPPRSPHRAPEPALQEQQPELGVTANEVLVRHPLRPVHRAGDGLSAIIQRAEGEESARPSSGRGEADERADELEEGVELEVEVSARTSAAAWEAAAAAEAEAAEAAEEAAEAAVAAVAAVAAGETPRPRERRRARGGIPTPYPYPYPYP